ncbi:hypothetical protein AEGHOMDF_3871 [Methylobacterium soli]|nr:hypothetical protein AEGHOMDF_3871 [Methylobacterium soli]
MVKRSLNRRGGFARAGVLVVLRKNIGHGGPPDRRGGRATLVGAKVT